MGAFGFPSGKDMSEMFGYVTEEDRTKWEQERQARQESTPGTAHDMASKSIAPALDMAKHGVQAQMHGAQFEAQRGGQPKQRQRVVTRETVTEQSHNIGAGEDSGYSPDF